VLFGLQLFLVSCYALLPYAEFGLQNGVATVEQIPLLFCSILNGTTSAALPLQLQLSKIDAILCIASAIQSAAIGFAILSNQKGIAFNNMQLVWILMVSS
jgi:hypothetical protein